jgi:inorganic pyrophosphatase
LAQEPVVPLCFLRAKPIGVMQMIDQGEQVRARAGSVTDLPSKSYVSCSAGVKWAQDDKIIAVHHDDPEFRHYEDISQLPKHRLMEIRRRAPQGPGLPAARFAPRPAPSDRAAWQFL